MHASKAIVRYGPGLMAIAKIDQNISDFYRSLIPKYYNVKPQRYKAHITIVRFEKEKPLHLDLWGKYDGKTIDFIYDPDIQTDGVYFWLNAYSEEIGHIRQELGLPKFRDDTEFGGILRKEYHITIANTKG
jgi:hypothetical protein